MSTEQDHRKLQQQLQEYQHKNTELQHEVKKWSQYCAYIAGISIGAIIFAVTFGKPEECDVCEECTICEECETCPEPTVCPEPVDCPEVKAPTPATQQVQEVRKVKKAVVVPKNVDPTAFPRTYVIQKGDNFSTIAQSIYGRSSWGTWLAEQNGIDPSKMQIGQEITLPIPKE